MAPAATTKLETECMAPPAIATVAGDSVPLVEALLAVGGYEPAELSGSAAAAEGIEV